MDGKKIKEILKQEGISIKDLATSIGLENDQALHNALRSDNIKTGLLEDIARVTNKSICFFYDGNGSTMATDNGLAVSGNSNQLNVLSEKFIALLTKKDEQIDRLIALLEKNSK